MKYISYTLMLYLLLSYNINSFFIFNKMSYIFLEEVSYKFLSNKLIQKIILKIENNEKSQDSEITSESRDQTPDEVDPIFNEPEIREKPPEEEETSSPNDEQHQDIETPLSEEEELRDDISYSDIIEDHFKIIFDLTEYIVNFIIENNFL